MRPEYPEERGIRGQKQGNVLQNIDEMRKRVRCPVNFYNATGAKFMPKDFEERTMREDGDEKISENAGVKEEIKGDQTEKKEEGSSTRQ